MKRHESPRDWAVALRAVEILNVLERRRAARAADRTEPSAEHERSAVDERYRHVEGRVAVAEEAVAATELAWRTVDADRARIAEQCAALEAERCGQTTPRSKRRPLARG